MRIEMILKRRPTPRVSQIPLVALVFLLGATLPSFLRSTATATETGSEGGRRRQAHSGEQASTSARPRAADVPLAIVAQASTTRAVADGALRQIATRFTDEPAAHARYTQMIDAMHKARSLSYVSHYQREAK